MIYKNKILQKKKERMAKLANGTIGSGTIGPESIISANRMKKPTISKLAQMRRKENLGGGESGLSSSEKVLDKAADLGTVKPVPTKLNNPSNIKVREELYGKMAKTNLKGLQKLALTDTNAKEYLLRNKSKLGV